jgi:hypothetical protein
MIVTHPSGVVEVKLARHPSASNTDAFVVCGASHVLVQHDKLTPQAEGGSAGHDVLAGAINGRVGGMVALKKALPHFDLPLLLDGVENPRGEAAFVINVKNRTSVYLGKEIARDYEGKLGRPLEAYEFGVSLDVDGMKNGAPWVRDFKFGHHSTVWQVRIQAMAVAWNTDAAMVDVGLVYVDASDGGANPIEDARQFFVYELDEHADLLVAAWDRVLAIQAEVDAGKPMADLATVEGPHCTYCGAYPHCPSKWKLAKSMMGGLDVGAIEAMTLDQCGIVWAKWKEIEKLGKSRIEDVIKLRMKQEGGIPLPNGKIARMSDMPGRHSMDLERAREMLMEKGATVEEIQSLVKQGESYQRVTEYKR